jgi:Ca2+-binding EF-hand superfamily protein
LTLIIGAFVNPAQASSCGGENHVHNTQKMAEMYFMEMDLDGDGTVNKTEFGQSKISKMIKPFDVLRPDEEGLVQKTTLILAFVKAHSKPKTEI